ncbi:MAG: class I SAM-dependent methyltransferase [Symploca sp. SIO2E9]|nr:class I SAM-dependent methyltransferase [Symploca sp. SIO2E9]
MIKDQPLQQIIYNQIAAAPQKRITFAEYMDLALYHPQQGYYATGAVNIGSEGDFFTSPHLGKDFGELLARQFAQIWDILGKPTPFTLVEMGAGQGLLAADILSYLHSQHPDCFAAVEYIIVEKATGLISQQQQLLQKLKLPNQDNHQQLPVRWCSLEAIPENSITGCCFSNELVDALPVHQFVLQQRQLREIYVTTADQLRVSREKEINLEFESSLVEDIQNQQSSPDSDDEIKFVEVTDTPSTPRLREYFNWLGIDLLSGAYCDGYRSEVNLAALEWLKNIANRLKRGFLLTIDYGYTAERYYLSARHQGTLQCYYHHRYHDDPYLYIGHQDITAHVNFTALERQGELCSLHKVGFTQQGLFLMALGLGERLLELSATGEAIAKGKDVLRIMRRRQALHELIDPMGIGGFGVLVQSKGLSWEQGQIELQGLSVPGERKKVWGNN